MCGAISSRRDGSTGAIKSPDVDIPWAQSSTSRLSSPLNAPHVAVSTLSRSVKHDEYATSHSATGYADCHVVVAARSLITNQAFSVTLSLTLSLTLNLGTRFQWEDIVTIFLYYYIYYFLGCFRRRANTRRYFWRSSINFSITVCFDIYLSQLLSIYCIINQIYCQRPA